MTRPPVMPQLHPDVPAGLFDLPTLLALKPPKRWQPEPGESFQGEVVKVIEQNAFGRRAKVLFVMANDGRYLTVTASGVILKNFIDDSNPEPGDTVAIRFNGWRKSQSSDREYRDFSCALRKKVRR